MYIESVTAIAFGPFRNTTLTLSPQFTIVYGPNEAGKSSWHAAIYAGICGMRRARGPALKEDREFSDLRRPWNSDLWEVHTLVRLNDGRRVEIRQNLADLARCSAVDADFGRDLTSEILNEGTPDATKWLGLNRQSFLAVACVRQAQIQAVTSSAESLQEELQRAAASAASDATATKAITALESFLSENLGLERANSKKPLQAAIVRVADAEKACKDARQKHAEWLRLESEAIRLRKNADDAARAKCELELLRIRREARDWEGKLAKARELAVRYPTSPLGPVTDEVALAEDVAAALTEWGNRTGVPVLKGRPASEIEVEIETLPATPIGDQAPKASVLAAKSDFEKALQAVEIHVSQQPPAPRVVDAKGLSPEELRGIAVALETFVPAVDPALEHSYQNAQDNLAAVGRAALPKGLLVGLAIVAVVAGTAALEWWNRFVGGGIVLAGIATLIWVILRSGDRLKAVALEALRSVEAQVVSQRQASEAARKHIEAAQARVLERGLPTKSSDLRVLAEEITVAQIDRQNSEAWSQVHEKLSAHVSATRKALLQALEDRGIKITNGDLLEAFREYEGVCRMRAEQASRASRRRDLEVELENRRTAEATTNEIRTRTANASQNLFSAARRCGFEVPDEQRAVEELKHWQQIRAVRLAEFEAATREYAELKALLNGGTLDDLEARASEIGHKEQILDAGIGPIPDLAPGTDLDKALQSAIDSANSLDREADGAAIRASQKAIDLPSVAEAEEEFTAAAGELQRVRDLGRNLELTLNFLRNAEERVHRSIAPVLAAGLKQSLSLVTKGRYTDARVDPSELSVQVLGADGQWRKAQSLSHGTAEQIYLLLRMTLADRLTRRGEVSPIILDDVLVQCDKQRKIALLDVLLTMSRTRQVILLTQEDEVLNWARENLTAPNELIMLPVPA